MQGACFDSVQRVALRTLDDAAIVDASDAVVQVKVAGLCGSDLHPFFGRETGLDGGTVMGHEFVGNIIALGKDVKGFRIGDRVCAPFTTNCGDCFYCRTGLTSRCVRGQLFGWRENGTGLHGGQSQYVRVPMADATLMRIPDAMSDDVALLIGDNLSTGHFCAEMAGIHPSGTYAVIGCGTVGLLAIASAFRMGASAVIAIDPNMARRKIAEQLGALAFADASEAMEVIKQRTEGRGVDAVMELVGLPVAQRLAVDLVRPGGILSVIGCHCTPNFAFSPVDAYDKNLTYRTGRCPARHYMSLLADELADAESMNLSWCVTHRFTVQECTEAYDVFANRKDGCVKAVIDFD